MWGGAKIKVFDDIGNSQELRKFKNEYFLAWWGGGGGVPLTPFRAPFGNGFRGPHNHPEGPDPKPDADEIHLCTETTEEVINGMGINSFKTQFIGFRLPQRDS